MKITKAVIPCGGMGTRFLPITKAVPKELLPIIDIPTVAYIIEEAAKSGITDVLLILGNGKEAIKKYFSSDQKLIDFLTTSGKTKLANLAKNTDFGINISYTYQEKPAGSADAVYYAKSFVGNQPFCLAWGDDVIFASPTAMSQLCTAYQQAKNSIVGVQYYASDDITKYGVAELTGNNNSESRLKKCTGFVEKPPIDKLPSRYAALGRYVLTPDIFSEIENLPSTKGELQLTDAINNLAKKDKVYIYDFIGKRYDCGDKFGYIKATIEYALKREFSLELKEYLKELVKNF